MPDSITIPIEISDDNQLLPNIRRSYVIEDEGSLTAFFRMHPHLPQLLIDAVPRLSRFFGNAAILLLVRADEDGWEMAYAIVQWPGEPDDALEALDRFDEAWWLANSDPAGTTLTFTYQLI